MVNKNIFEPAKKRSITIAGHPTSIRIESLFWDELVRVAREGDLPISALVAQIDVQRLAVNPAPNLASAIRLWLFDRANAAGKSAETVGNAP
jgi:predicted DNA-binding ribbon-helix-helix protein